MQNKQTRNILTLKKLHCKIHLGDLGSAGFLSHWFCGQRKKQCNNIYKLVKASRYNCFVIIIKIRNKKCLVPTYF